MGEHKQKVLIVSNGFPNYGGLSTTAYNLLKLLRSEKYDARLVCITIVQSADADPDKTGASYKVILRNYFAKRVYNTFNKDNKIASSGYVKQAKKYYYVLKLLPLLLIRLISINFFPDIVITNVPAYAWILRTIFRRRKVLVIVSTSPEMSELSKLGIDAQSVIENPGRAIEALRGVNKYDFAGSDVLFDSSITQRVYNALQIRYGKATVQYFNITPQQEKKNTDFADRKYDLAFIISDFTRSVKNTDLAYRIFKSSSLHSKIAIGKGSSKFSDISNTETKELVSQEKVIEVLANTKLVIITSYFDSSPGVLSEAILYGCNVLVSKNVGWYEVLGNESFVDDYMDIEEWKRKAALLTNNKVDYSDFEKIIARSSKEILQLISSL